VASLRFPLFCLFGLLVVVALAVVVVAGAGVIGVADDVALVGFLLFLGR